MRHLYALDRRRDRRPFVALALLVLGLLGVRLLTMTVVAQPGYTDAYYYASVAERVAHGDGLTADFVWNFLEAPRLASLPIASHRFWMPLATLVQAAGIATFGEVLGSFRAGQVAIVAVASAIPVVTYVAARSFGAGVGASLVAALVAGLGGAFAPAWVSVDAFGIGAVLGTAFFLVFARAARGSVRAGAVAGLLVGALYLARAEGAIFGLALLWLAGRRSTKRAGIVGSGVALAIGLAWLARSVALGFPSDLLARAVLPVRYEDFFALRAPSLEGFVGAPVDVIAARANALVANAVTAAIALLLVPVVPLALAVRRRWDRADVRAFVLLALAVYLAQSLVFAVHSVRGSWFHATVAFFPLAVALAAAGTEELVRGTSRAMLRTVAGSAVAAVAAVSLFAVAQWDVDFNTPYRERAAAAALLPPGPLVVTDAAAWRWISGHEAILAPSDGPGSAACAAAVYLATTLVLEPAHFARYEDLYRSQRSDQFTSLHDLGGIRLYAVRQDQRCITARSARTE